MPTVYTDPGAIGNVVATTGKGESTWANAMRDRVVHHFSSAAARDTAIPSPTAGMMCFLTSNNRLFYFNGTRWRLMVEHDQQVRQSTDLTINTSTYVDVDTATDLGVPCTAGDWLEFTIAGAWGGEAVDGHLAVRSVTRASDTVGPVGTSGLPGCFGGNGLRISFSTTFLYQSVAGDISGGVAAFRLRAKVGTASVNKTLNAGTVLGLAWHVKNLGL